MTAYTPPTYYISTPEPGDFRGACNSCSWVGKYVSSFNANRGIRNHITRLHNPADWCELHGTTKTACEFYYPHPSFTTKTAADLLHHADAIQSLAAAVVTKAETVSRNPNLNPITIAAISRMLGRIAERVTQAQNEAKKLI